MPTYNPDDHERGHPVDMPDPRDAVIESARKIAAFPPRKKNATAYAALVSWTLINELRHAIDRLDEVTS